tara:strand:- start:3890 stop:5254 length:1365 start_codon:yes stop_codon:yes gene_type:complete
LQKTLNKSVTFQGHGLHTGEMVKIICHPAPIDSGIRFQRIDLEEKTIIEANIQNISETNRRTVLKRNQVSIETVEHLLAAIYALGISNLIIQANGPEIPILDGSAYTFYTLLEKTGIKTQYKNRKQFKCNQQFKVELKEENAKIEFYPSDGLEIEVKIDYKSNVLLPQKIVLKDFNDFKDKISPARTFCFLHELDELVKLGLIKGSTIDTGVVFVEKDTNINTLGSIRELIEKGSKVVKKGIFNDRKNAISNEQAKHKLIDLIGDLSLAGFELKGKIIASKPGHYINSLFTKKLIKMSKEIKKVEYPKPIMTKDKIKQILPHREPFLFIDEILELGDSYVTGLKYVKKTEYYFKGHFPGSPIMPGVLQLEAMAQTGGILALNSVPDPENYLTYFMKIDKVKFKQKVEPNCTLIFKLHLISPIRRGICHMKGEAYVDDKIVSEAELMAKIVKEKI